MTMTGEKPAQQRPQTVAAATAAAVATVTGKQATPWLGQAGNSHGEEEKQTSTHQRSQNKQPHRTLVDQLTYSKMAHLLAVYQNKVQENSRVISKLKRQKDAQLQAVISKLLLLEAHLRKEQKGIVGQLAQRDHVISAQRQEIDRLRRDNRRLINKLKKFSEVCLESGDMEFREPRLKISRVESTEENSDKQRSPTHPSSPSSRKSSSGMIRVATSVSELINCSGDSSFVKPQIAHYHTSQSTSSLPPPQTVNPNVTYIRATTDRVLHKPPIAEKPRIAARLVRGQQLSQKGQQLIRTYGGKQCNIVSTISRLLEEESDATTTGGSGSSEPSSPEATLKPNTPRVIRLARQFEEGFNSQNLVNHGSQASSDSSPESSRQDDNSTKSYIMDEYEVTSGYNSDAISDHEYENVQVMTQEGCGDSPKYGQEGKDQDDEEEEDNYVILRAVKETSDCVNWVDIPEDQHIYSNVEFSSGLLVKEVEEEEDHPEPEENQRAKLSPNKSAEGKMLETNLDVLNTSGSENHLLSESPRGAKNVPRCRHNINLIMESDGDHMTENFEEFTLDSLELEEEEDREREEEEEEHGRGKENLPLSAQRRCGDGAETKLDGKGNENVTGNSALPSHMANGQYEKFLEATGLSQKSILTPTRMFSNHRSVLKPRDVKHRNKLRAAFTTLSTLEESPGSGGGSRYWTEPFL